MNLVDSLLCRRLLCCLFDASKPQFLGIYKELLTSFTLALVAVAFLSVFALGQISIVLLVCFTVVSLP